MRRKLTHGILIGVLAAIISWSLWSLGALQWIENESWDWRVKGFAKPGPNTEKVQIVLIDQSSLDWGRQEQGWAWPWPRIAYGAVADFCSRAGAKAVIFDMVFTEPSIWERVYGEDDAPFGKSLSMAPSPVLGFQLLQKQGTTTNWPSDFPKPGLDVAGLKEHLQSARSSDLVFGLAAFPVAAIGTNCAMLGDVSGVSDDDSVVRRYSPFHLFDGLFVPSLGLAAHLSSSPEPALTLSDDRLKLPAAEIPLDSHSRAILRFRGLATNFPTVSIQSVIQSEIRLQEGNSNTVLNPQRFKDCYVFVGSSAAGLLDLKASPINPVVPGVVIHATFLDNLLSNDFMREVPVTGGFLITILFGVLAGAVGRLCQNGRQAVAAFALLLPSPLVPAYMLYYFGLWVPVAAPGIAVALGLIGGFILNYAMEGRQKRFIKTAFKQYLSPHVIERLVNDPKGLKLGGETRELSIYFSDLQGFTTISESLSPEQLTALLNEYLTAMSDIIMEEGGTVDKYEGDAVIAFWNAPLDLQDHAKCAVRSALRCQKKLDEIRPLLLAKYGKNLFCRIGLNTGKVVIGNMGSNQRFNYTFLGDAGNLAARLEGANKQFGSYMMISEFTRAQIGDEFAVRELSSLRVKGKLKPVGVFEPMYKEDYEARKTVYETFATALAAYYEGKFQAALEGFSKIADQDAPARSYVPRCKELLANPPSQWDGVWELTEK